VHNSHGTATRRAFYHRYIFVIVLFSYFYYSMFKGKQKMGTTHSCNCIEVVIAHFLVTLVKDRKD